MNIKLADIPMSLENISDRLKRFFKDYETSEEALFKICIEDDDLEHEKAIVETLPEIQKYSAFFIESQALYRKIVNRLLDYDVILFHSSALMIDDEAYVFTGRSGQGKSTHSALYRELYDVTMINDDKPLFRYKDDRFYAYGTPYDGKHHLSNNVSYPIKGICFIEQSATNHIRKLDRNEAFPKLYIQTHIEKDKDLVPKGIKLVNRLNMNVPTYELSCDISLEAAQMSYEAIRNG